MPVRFASNDYRVSPYTLLAIPFMILGMFWVTRDTSVPFDPSNTKVVFERKIDGFGKPSIFADDGWVYTQTKIALEPEKYRLKAWVEYTQTSANSIVLHCNADIPCVFSGDSMICEWHEP